MSTPYIGFGNDQLEGAPLVKDGDLIFCPHCFSEHAVARSWSSDGSISLDTYCCGETAYLCGMNGKLIMGVKPACSGSIDFDAWDQDD